MPSAAAAQVVQNAVQGTRVWAAFLKRHNLNAVKLFEYYDIVPKTWSADAAAGLKESSVYQARIAQEFFRDLVGVGAITLPAGKKAEDFNFVILKDSQLVTSPFYLYMKHPSETDAVKVLAGPNIYFNDDVKMGGPSLKNAIHDLTRATTELFR